MMSTLTPVAVAVVAADSTTVVAFVTVLIVAAAAIPAPTTAAPTSALVNAAVAETSDVSVFVTPSVIVRLYFLVVTPGAFIRPNNPLGFHAAHEQSAVDDLAKLIQDHRLARHQRVARAQRLPYEILTRIFAAFSVLAMSVSCEVTPSASQTFRTRRTPHVVAERERDSGLPWPSPPR